ncbi:MAG: sensor histidine kinase [Methanobacteriaceae archaeon]|jgi:two-component sensor histidine kinase|nr:sensor histidine kinase [Methanobacteriaceae archaeon]MDP2835993.1 sensor histidine kinase [Methanobacteriaceae archaeon]MDP3035767.1 sensor histidine kinase [Methanobacteriaceae archaeon]MDP3484064.1 sensor histidine kinase [Methanobacteriaceae archaeon]MDP3622817.1 sensor histidine kinase [Methanobacteriaceae archaeon]
MEKILILLKNPKNSEMISTLLGTNYDIICSLSEIDEYYKDTDTISLVITDLISWSRNGEKLKSIKEKEMPLFLPFLLVVAPNDLKNAQNIIWESFDEVIIVPITKIVLSSRVNVLLQTRELSLQVNQLLNDKEMLIKEIHHRVKNNLTVISSLLSLQSRYIKDESDKDLFKESENRAKSMALIHERLYRSEDVKSIDFSDYITSLSRDLFDTYVTSKDKIQLKLDVENIMVDVDNTVPLGLIINELVTNCLKYAFPSNRTGTININFHKIGSEYVLEVIDDGIGLPEDFDTDKSDSLGMRLISGLTAQLDGEMEMLNDSGTTFRIRFSDR